jgi:hypothetical protein
MHPGFRRRYCLPTKLQHLSCKEKRPSRKAGSHLKNLKRTNLLGSFFSFGMGLLFIYFSSQGFGLVYDFVFLLGIGFTVYGVVAQILNMLIFFKKKKKTYTNK